MGRTREGAMSRPFADVLGETPRAQGSEKRSPRTPVSRRGRTHVAGAYPTLRPRRVSRRWENLVSIALERCLLSERVADADVFKRSEEFKTAFLASVSHDR